MSDADVGPINVVGGALLAQVSLLAIMLCGGLLIARRDMKAWLILALALLSLGMLLTSDAFSSVWAPLLEHSMPGLVSWSSALLWTFILDIVVLTILVFGTGGGAESPFQPLYFLLPTLAIFLHEPTGRVVTYLILVSISFSTSMSEGIHRLTISDYPDRAERGRWRVAYWFVSLASCALATSIGLMTRRL